MEFEEHWLNDVKDGAYYCYCAYVMHISRHSGFLWVVLINTGIFLRGSKLCSLRTQTYFRRSEKRRRISGKTETYFRRSQAKNYAEKAELSKCFWYPKRKLGVTTHFSEIIKLQFGKERYTFELVGTVLDTFPDASDVEVWEDI